MLPRTRRLIIGLRVPAIFNDSVMGIPVIVARKHTYTYTNIYEYFFHARI